MIVLESNDLNTTQRVRSNPPSTESRLHKAQLLGRSRRTRLPEYQLMPHMSQLTHSSSLEPGAQHSKASHAGLLANSSKRYPLSRTSSKF
jgi:hypothetical protein